MHQIDYQKKITKAKEMVMEKVSFILERDFKKYGGHSFNKKQQHHIYITGKRNHK